MTNLHDNNAEHDVSLLEVPHVPGERVIDVLGLRLPVEPVERLVVPPLSLQLLGQSLLAALTREALETDFNLGLF